MLYNSAIQTIIKYFTYINNILNLSYSPFFGEVCQNFLDSAIYSSDGDPSFPELYDTFDRFSREFPRFSPVLRSLCVFDVPHTHARMFSPDSSSAPYS